MNGNFQNHARPAARDSTTRSVVDGRTEETSRTLHDVRAIDSIIQHTGLGFFDVNPTVCSAATRATRDEEQEEQCSEIHGEATWEPRGQRPEDPDRKPLDSFRDTGWNRESK